MRPLQIINAIISVDQIIPCIFVLLSYKKKITTFRYYSDIRNERYRYKDIWLNDIYFQQIKLPLARIVHFGSLFNKSFSIMKVVLV